MSMLCKQKSALTRANFSPSLFLCFLLPISWGANIDFQIIDDRTDKRSRANPAQEG